MLGVIYKNYKCFDEEGIRETRKLWCPPCMLGSSGHTGPPEREQSVELNGAYIRVFRGIDFGSSVEAPENITQIRMRRICTIRTLRDTPVPLRSHLCARGQLLQTLLLQVLLRRQSRSRSMMKSACVCVSIITQLWSPRCVLEYAHSTTT